MADDGSFTLTFEDGSSTKFIPLDNGGWLEIDSDSDGEPLVAREYNSDGEVIHYYIWEQVGTDKDGNPVYGWRKVFQPSSPENENDTVQDYFKSQMLRKMLMLDRENPLDKEEYIEVENPDGRKQFIRNPFYRGKDPMKEIYWKHKNANGTWGFSRNPFAPPSETAGKYKNTYESRVNSNMGDMTGGFIDPPPPYVD